MATSWVSTFEPSLLSLPGSLLPVTGSQPRFHNSSTPKLGSFNFTAQKLCSSSGSQRLGTWTSSSGTGRTFAPQSSVSDDSNSGSNLESQAHSNLVKNMEDFESKDTNAADSLGSSESNLGTKEETVIPKVGPAQSALDRARSYKKMKYLGSSRKPQIQSPSMASSAPVPPSNLPKVEIVAGRPIESSSTPSSPSFSNLSSSRRTEFAPSAPLSSSLSQQQSSSQPVNENSLLSRPISQLDGNQDGNKTISVSAFEKAQAYKLQQAEMVAALRDKDGAESSAPSPKDDEEKVVEIEIYTREGVIKRRVSNPETAFANVKDLKRKGMSDIDFAGFGFADKKSSSAMPAGLSEGFEAPSGPLPEVEILTRDAGKALTPMAAREEASEVYRPRVSTWGVFPRPANISKAYGGGRTIRPGQKLETAEEKAAREAQTKKLLDDYRSKMGLDIDPKTKARCERNMKQGENMMERGRLREALVAFGTVMEEMAFASELHGLAALQAAVCLDSLNRSQLPPFLAGLSYWLGYLLFGVDVGRSGEAKAEYEKLVSHPNGAVRKKARQFLFGFQVLLSHAPNNSLVSLKSRGGGGSLSLPCTMKVIVHNFGSDSHKAAEKLKVRGGYNWDSSTYRKYFDAFADGYNTTYKGGEEDVGNQSLNQTLPYIIFLIFPVLLVFALATLKNT